MILIVGLGNPGEKYQKSRHNIGFMVLDELARKILPLQKTEWKKNKKANSLILEISQFPISNFQFPIILAKPQTMMNASGYAVEKILRYYDIKKLSDLWIVHDDLDLPLGKIKIRIDGGTAGHHGIESIVEELGTADFVRFRVGIGRPVGRGQPAFAKASAGKWEVARGRLVSENAMHREVEEYVLEEFRGKEAVEAAHVIKKTVEAIKWALERGLEEARNRYKSK